MLIRFSSISALRLSKRMRGKEPVWEMNRIFSRLSLLSCCAVPHIRLIHSRVVDNFAFLDGKEWMILGAGIGLGCGTRGIEGYVSQTFYLRQVSIIITRHKLVSRKAPPEEKKVWEDRASEKYALGIC